MENFSEIERLLKRNDTYTEESKKQEEKSRIDREPIGDWQSPSDAKRWAELHKSLELARLKYNINQSSDKKYEKEFLIDEKTRIETILKKNKEFIQTNFKPFEKIDETENKKIKDNGFFNRILNKIGFKTNSKNNEEQAPSIEKIDEIEKENRLLKRLLNDMNQQLSVYDFYIQKEDEK